MFIKRPIVNSKEEREAKQDIKELLEFERFSRDNAQWAEMRKCFTKDSYVNVSWFQGTGDEFVTASERMNSYAPHKVYNTHIWVNRDRAVAIMMATLQLRRVINNIEYVVDSDIKIVTGVVKQEGQWYIDRFECIYDKDEIRTVVPTEVETVSRVELSQYRESYACLSYITEKTGMKISQDMIGRDRPEMVEKLYQSFDNWLFCEAAERKSE